MTCETTKPDPAIVLDLIEAFRRSKAMFAAVELGIFDRLHSKDKSLDQLAHELNANRDSLERLLDACVGLGLLQRNELEYSNAPVASTYLTSSSPSRLTGYIRYSDSVMWRLWAHLADAVREGTHRWQQAYGWEGPIFSHFFQTEESKREFLMGMHGFGLISSPYVVRAFDLSRFQLLVDLGGATGHLAIEACACYPSLRAVVFDLPDAMPLAKEIVGQSPVANRIELVSGDFFVDALPTADLFALGRIVHDWSEEKIMRLLDRLVDRLPAGGGLLIAEKVLVDDKSGPRWAQMQNLNMLTCTEGKERTMSEYDRLLRRAGFSQLSLCRTTSPLDAILAIK